MIVFLVYPLKYLIFFDMVQYGLMALESEDYLIHKVIFQTDCPFFLDF